MSGARARREQTRGQTSESERKEDDGRGREEKRARDEEREFRVCAYFS